MIKCNENMAKSFSSAKQQGFYFAPWPQSKGKGVAVRRGRPRLVRDKRDCGTLELQQYKRMLVGEGADIKLSSTAVDILLAREILNKRQYNVALSYQRIGRHLKRIVGAPRMAENLLGRLESYGFLPNFSHVSFSHGDYPSLKTREESKIFQQWKILQEGLQRRKLAWVADNVLLYGRLECLKETGDHKRQHFFFSIRKIRELQGSLRYIEEILLPT